MVSCQGVVQLGGPSSGFSLVSSTKVEACKSFLFTENNSFVLNTWLILLSHFILKSLCFNALRSDKW